MHKKLVILYLAFVVMSISQNLFCQSVDSSSFNINSRFSFYSFEEEGEFLLHIPPGLSNSNLSIFLKNGDDTITSWKGIPGNKILRLPFSIDLKPSVYEVVASISVSWRPGVIYKATTNLNVLPYKPNEVKTDRLTGGLIVNRRKFFPFGFYSYSPIHPALPEEEVVKGFNVISPYQKILPETLGERKAYMDRCAMLGMKVHFNLLSVSGGGGVGSKIEGISDEEKRYLLIEEIITFRDHPALLGWYIADEPNGYRIPPEQIEEIYKTVKENDPWHPVSVVFMAPFLSSRNYINGLDIVMADPYPIPDLPASFVGNITGQLTTEFRGKRPVWIVPQAFGGGEIWEREPTLQEIRSMTWQSIIQGATGIQYFVRQGLNYFPKSTATWGECGRMAMEVAELTPWLLSDEKTLPVQSYSNNILVSSRVHNGQLIVMAVNRRNEPRRASISINGFSTGRARVLFENRSVAVMGGLLTDHLAPFGSQVYLINLKPGQQAVSNSNTNLIKDPGFEDLSTPGIPSACYARPGDDRGATYFLDTREHKEGSHSLRIVTPENNKSLYLRFFPFSVNAGASYSISIWAKSDPEQRFFILPDKGYVDQFRQQQMPQYVEILLGDFSRARFIPDKEWRRFVTFVTIPSDTLPTFKTNMILKMPGQGVAWFDQMKVFEEKPSD